jgi:hypothetical protein
MRDSVAGEEVRLNYGTTALARSLKTLKDDPMTKTDCALSVPAGVQRSSERHRMIEVSR